MAQDGDNPLRSQYRIGGAWIDGGEPGQSLDTATGEPIGTFCEADRRVVRQAIATAKDAFASSGWKDDRTRRARVHGRPLRGARRGAGAPARPRERQGPCARPLREWHRAPDAALQRRSGADRQRTLRLDCAECRPASPGSSPPGTRRCAGNPLPGAGAGLPLHGGGHAPAPDGPGECAHRRDHL